ncbi:MAG: type II toxin-antitoxin system Y4mF family antitoxin [Thermomonas sp.]
MNLSDSRTGKATLLADAGALGLAVRQVRMAHGLTQADLAGLAGTGPRFISELERGKPSAELGKVLDVLAVLGLRLCLLLPEVEA